MKTGDMFSANMNTIYANNLAINVNSYCNKVGLLLEIESNQTESKDRHNYSKTRDVYGREIYVTPSSFNRWMRISGGR